MELDEKAMLSAIAQLTPYSDFNQSPRNMYQCQVKNVMYGTINFLHKNYSRYYNIFPSFILNSTVTVTVYAHMLDVARQQACIRVVCK